MNIQTIVTKQFDWVDLQRTAIEGKLDSIIKTGDLIPFNLKTGEEVAVRATQDLHGKWFFVFEDCLNDTHAMNKTATNRGGWKACEMRKYLNKTVFDLLPDELQRVIVPTKIVQVLNGERVETEDKLFLPSKTQMFGKGAWSNFEPEDAQFIYYRREKDRVKECGENGTWWYFLRTPYSGNTVVFCGVYSGGYAYYTSASSNGGVAPGFCIG